MPGASIDFAIGRLDGLAADHLSRTGVPGMAIAVVHRDRVLYAKGFGTRELGTIAPVDADTVFQLASLSKSVGATAVACEIGRGRARWDTPMRTLLPWFALSDTAVTRELTVGDLYSHRSGLPDHAGDLLEDMGYGQREVLERLRLLPLGAFRKQYAYTNFGLTAAGIAVAGAAGTDWATLQEQALYAPLGMSRTSSRFADFASRSNRAMGHRRVDGRWERVQPPRMPDAQAPAASVTSSVNDLAKWLALLLNDGRHAGRRLVDAEALAAALSPQMQTSPAHDGFPANYYGYGFNVGTTAGGRASYGHSGAFEMGAATCFKVVPATGLAIIVLTNGYPVGLPESLCAQFFDLVEFGAPQRDWVALFQPAFAQMAAPSGSLVGVKRPASAAASRPVREYAGVYRNDYYGPLAVTAEGSSLEITLGAAPLRRPLSHWDGDTFTFTLDTENASPGTISRATFAPGRVTLEYYDEHGLGTFDR